MCRTSLALDQNGSTGRSRRTLEFETLQDERSVGAQEWAWRYERSNGSDSPATEVNDGAKPLRRTNGQGRPTQIDRAALERAIAAHLDGVAALGGPPRLGQGEKTPFRVSLTAEHHERTGRLPLDARGLNLNRSRYRVFRLVETSSFLQEQGDLPPRDGQGDCVRVPRIQDEFALQGGHEQGVAANASPVPPHV